MFFFSAIHGGTMHLFFWTEYQIQAPKFRQQYRFELNYYTSQCLVQKIEIWTLEEELGVVAQAYKPALGRQKQRRWVRDQLWLPSPNRYYIETSLVFIIIIKIAGYTRLWWYMPLIPTLKRQRRANVWVWKQPGLRSEFQDNQDYTEKHSLEKALT